MEMYGQTLQNLFMYEFLGLHHIVIETTITIQLIYDRWTSHSHIEIEYFPKMMSAISLTYSIKYSPIGVPVQGIVKFQEKVML